MDNLTNFAFNQRKYIPIFPNAIGKATVYIEGYPCEDDEPMAATGFHGVQINTFYDQLSRYFAVNERIYIGVDSFIYYSEGDIAKSVAPDIYVVFGVAKTPERRSFYTWAEGAAPIAVFEFLSDSTAHQDRREKVALYLNDIGVQEYFVHQPELKKPVEFCGWQRLPSGSIAEIVPDAEGALFSEALNLWFRLEEEQHRDVRLLRPSLPDGTPITTSLEEEHLRKQAQHRQEIAETIAREETERRKKAEAELERLRAQLANEESERS